MRRRSDLRRGRGRVERRARVVLVRRVGLAIALALALRATGACRRASRRPPRSRRPPSAEAGRRRRRPRRRPRAAKTKPAAGERALPAARLDALRAALFGEDDAAAVAAAEALGASGAGNAAEPLAELLAAGAAPARAEAALDALAKLGGGGALTAPRAFEVLDLYTGHRAPELRQRAIKALGTIKDPRVVPTLLARLGDAAPGVRAAAGEALAARPRADGEAAPVRARQARRHERGQPAGRAGDARPDSADRGAGGQRRRRRARDDAGRVRPARRTCPIAMRVDVRAHALGHGRRRGDDRAGRIHRVGARRRTIARRSARRRSCSTSGRAAR